MPDILWPTTILETFFQQKLFNHKKLRWNRLGKIFIPQNPDLSLRKQKVLLELSFKNLEWYIHLLPTNHLFGDHFEPPVGHFGVDEAVVHVEELGVGEAEVKLGVVSDSGFEKGAQVLEQGGGGQNVLLADFAEAPLDFFESLRVDYQVVVVRILDHLQAVRVSQFYPVSF